MAQQPIDPTQLNTTTLLVGARGLIDVQVFTSSGTWNRPTNTVAIEFWAVGGGGGGAGVGSSVGVGLIHGGGGGAGMVYDYLTSGFGASESVTVGIGGAGGVGGVNGTTGTSSAFLTRFGGGGIGGGTTQGVFASGAAGSNGLYGVSGGDGSETALGALVPLPLWSSVGGDSGGGFGFGGSSRVLLSAGVQTGSNANGFGGGGGGAAGFNSASTANGGFGTNGIVIIKSYA